MDEADIVDIVDVMDFTRLLAVADAMGAADAEVASEKTGGLVIEVAQGEIEAFALSESIGLGVRLFTPDRRMGYAYSGDLAQKPEATVEEAWRNAQANEPDEFNALPDSASVSAEDWSEEDLRGVPVESKIAFARELDQRALAFDPRISQVRLARYSESAFEFHIANSRGLQRRYSSAYCSCSVAAVSAQAGADSEMGHEFDFGFRFDALRGDWVAERAAAEAVGKLGGKPCLTGPVPVVLDNAVATDILAVIGPALKGSNVLKRKSLFAGAIGNDIASRCVTIVDQNDLRTGMNRAPFDGEGSEAQTTPLVKNGSLLGYLHNTYTAAKMGAKTTANAGRGIGGPPEVGASNCYLEPGAPSQADLIAMAGDGFFITDVLGMHTADPVSGDFSVGAAGRLIKNGRLSRPVRGVTIAGNIVELLQRIEAAGDDLRFFGAYGAPSLLVSEIMVSGE